MLSTNESTNFLKRFQFVCPVFLLCVNWLAAFSKENQVKQQDVLSCLQKRENQATGSNSGVAKWKSTIQQQSKKIDDRLAIIRKNIK